ncbi:MAG TPA: WbqC family protein [bacterium]|nr:WbqC family protein [bacterium]
MLNRTAVIHQPDFIPYLGFFHRLLYADLFIILDSVQYVRGSRSWTSRDKIKTAGGIHWLSIPVRKCARATPISEVIIADELPWQEGHLNILRESYRKAAGFAEVWPHIEHFYCGKYQRLIEATTASINLLLELLAIRVPCVLASTLQPQGQKSELLAGLLEVAGIGHYLSGVGARAYLDMAPFRKRGIAVRYQEFHHPVYPQMHGAFVANLSALDLLLNCGINSARRIVREDLKVP